MCGIVGGIAKTNVVPVLVNGLQRLEYRGYDSCGVAVGAPEGFRRVRSVGRVSELMQMIEEGNVEGTIGISHTRWATHGGPKVMNAHPHISSGTISVVHNGIIENHHALREMLKAKGYTFESETDTEVIAHLVHSHYRGNLADAVQRALPELRGAYAIAVLSATEQDVLVGARKGSPMVVGRDANGYFIASDAMALSGVANEVCYLGDGDMVILTNEAMIVKDHAAAELMRAFVPMPTIAEASLAAPYTHYMQKEIFEQPDAIARTIHGIEAIDPRIFGGAATDVFRDIDRVLILACGTSFYSGLTAKYWIESIAQVPVSVEVASEYRYRTSVAEPRTLVVVISQSGETADTLAALAHAKAMGMTNTLAICNVPTSAMVRETRLQYITKAGVEVGVASTKAFTTQLSALYLFACALAHARGVALTDDTLPTLRALPEQIAGVLALEPQLIAWAETLAGYEHAIFLGRGVHYPIALEGALKLKEISYIHAEAYPAGELKHGPLALISPEMPVVVTAPHDALLEKLASNIAEVHARGGKLFVVADDGAELTLPDDVRVIHVPNAGVFAPIIHVIALQLLAYHTALLRGNDVDKPRNLAKSVTVE